MAAKKNKLNNVSQSKSLCMSVSFEHEFTLTRKNNRNMGTKNLDHFTKQINN